ncbi:MAG: DUF6279 family lipoprotein [Fibrobacteria bacterium]
MSLAAISAITLAATGCNKIKLGYEYADWVVTYSVEDNFDLEKPQRIQLKDDVHAYFRWHRKDLLPVYADFAEWIADNARNGIQTSEVDSGYHRYRELYRRTLEPTVEKSVNLLITLTPGQVDQWLERVHKKNAKQRRDFSGSLDERLDHRYGKIIDELEDWTGKLSKEQRNRIKVLNRTLPWNSGLRLELREKVQEHLAGILKKKASREEIHGYLANYVMDTDSLKSEEYRVQCREFDSRLRTMVYQIHNILNPEQKRRFIQQVEKLGRDFRTLSAQD